jgi:hypothetical protein
VAVWLPVKAETPASPVGVFEDHQDVGAVLHAGAASFNPSDQSYVVSGSGENMWFAADAFHFVWKKVSGDTSLAATLSFPGSGGNRHRKAVLMVRQSLDADSAYADVAVHGDGLTSLQFRDDEGAGTHEIQSSVSGPERARLEKRGDHVTMWLAAKDGDFRLAAGSMRLGFKDPFYVGIGVCSHEKDIVEKARFSDVELKTLPAPAHEPTLYSALETVTVASTDRRAVYVAAGRLEGPHWAPDGSALFFRAGGRVQRLPLAGGPPEGVDMAAAEGPLLSPDGQRGYFSSARDGGTQIWRRRPDAREEQVTRDAFDNVFPSLSEDGERLAFLSFDRGAAGSPEDKDAVLRVMSLGESSKIDVIATLLAGPGTMGAPSWSPDGRQLAFVSYHWVP